MSSASSPPLRLDVVHMRVLAGLDRSHRAADVDAVFDDGIADVYILQRDLVAERDVLGAAERDRAVLIEDEAGQLLSRFDALDHHDGHGIAGVMQNTMDHCCLRRDFLEEMPMA